MPFPLYVIRVCANTHTPRYNITLLRILHIHTRYFIYNINNTVDVGLRLNFLTYFDLFNKSFSRVLHNSNGNWTIAV